MDTTTIKHLKDGRELTYHDGAVYLAGQWHSTGTAVALTTAERSRVPAGYAWRVGVVVLSDAEVVILQAAHAAWQAEQAREQARPERVERRRIEAMYAEAERLIDWPDSSITMRQRADAALAAWREQYPEAAREERRTELQEQAAHLRSLAAGALTYDADGSLTAEMQQARHDEYMRQAEEIDAQAAAL